MLTRLRRYLPLSWRWGPQGSAPSEAKDHRSLPRIFEEHATAIIDKTSYKLNDWNPKGFTIAPYEGRYGVGSMFRVALVIPGGGKTFRFVAEAKVVTQDKKSKQLAAVFMGLDAGTAKRLTYLAMAKL